MTSIDRHELALISIVGSFLDVLGALYLAYDLLGGKQGPLRLLTRAVTYAVLFGVGYGIPLGLAFGVAAGAAHGLTLAFELSRASQMKSRYPPGAEAICSAVRGLGFGIGAGFLYGSLFGAIFGALSTAGQIAAYRTGIYPGMALQPHRAPAITPKHLLSGVIRSIGYGFAGYLSAAITHRQMHAAIFGIEAGLTIGVVTVVAMFLSPFIEWTSNTIENRTLGVAGVVLILFGFGAQSVQYWVALMDVRLR